MVRRSRRGNRRMRNTRNTTSTRQTHGYINGGKRRARPNPRSIVYNPWNNLSLQRMITIPAADTTKPHMIDIDYLDDAIRQQIGIRARSETATAGTYTDIAFQLRSITVHQLDGLPVGLTLLEPILEGEPRTGAGGQLVAVSDFPGRNSWAAVSASYPVWVQKQTLSVWDNSKTDVKGFDVAAIITNSGNASSTDLKVLVTVRLVWQPVIPNDTVGSKYDLAHRGKLRTHRQVSHKQYPQHVDITPVVEQN